MHPVIVLMLAAGLVACGARGASSTATSQCVAPSGRMIALSGGPFVKGAHSLYPEERPTLTVHVEPIAVLAHEVTNDDFAAFVAETGYVTDAERSGSALFVAPMPGAAGHWRLERGATWRRPNGSGSTIEGRGHYPVVHVSLNDARRYAAWAGARLPNEIEWEYAAWSGLRDATDPLSGVVDASGEPAANIWHGVFPLQNSADDGFAAAAPVACFAPDKNGVHDLIGNVWEWTETPAGPGLHVIKGGSFLCAANYCRRYRTAAREEHEVDFSASHIGFRIVRDGEAQLGQ